VLLDLTPDEVLKTTRAVRRRLDLERPVEREVLEECLRLAQQRRRLVTARTGTSWSSPIPRSVPFWVSSGAVRRTLSRRRRPGPGVELPHGTRRLLDSVWHLMDHIGDVPVHVIPCIEGRTDGKGVPEQASRFGTIVPAVWSFMLAARTRGLGTCWTTFHLAHEEEAAELLGIPYADVMQVALIPVAYTVGTEFRPARRKPLETIVHWDGW
jgi:nitroreductase